MSTRTTNPLRLLIVVLLAAVVAVALLGSLVVAVVVVARNAEPSEDATAPDAPADLCAVIGREDLALWSPDADAASSVDGGQATCEASSPETDGDAYVIFRAEVTRGAPREDQPGASGAEQASSWLEIRCADPVEDDIGLGDESCLERWSGAGETASAAVTVRQGADQVRVTYDGRPLGTDEARRRVVEAATRILAALE